MFKKSYIVIGIFLGLTSTSIYAHNMWLDKTGYGYDFAYGEEGHRDLYDPSRVTNISAYRPTHEKVELDIQRHILANKKGLARIYLGEESYTVLTAELDNKYWFHLKDSWKNTDKLNTTDIISEEGNSYKSTKHIVEWNDFITKPLGQNIEIVPLEDPTKLKEGDEFLVQIYLNGKKLEDYKETKITNNSNASIEDNKLFYLKSNEAIKIKISKAGLQLINAKYKQILDDKKVIWYSFTLTFNTKL